MNWLVFAAAAVVILVITGFVIFVMYQTSRPQVYLWYNNGKNPDGRSAAISQAINLGGIIAIPQQVDASQQDGAAWCAAGYASDGNVYFPAQSTEAGCGTKGVNPSDCASDYGNNCGVLVYGKKPPSGSADILPFNGSQWSQWKWDQPFH